MFYKRMSYFNKKIFFYLSKYDKKLMESWIFVFGD